MTQIGQPKREIYVEPMVIPVPLPLPETEPAPAIPEPTRREEEVPA